jgi:NAD(P)-dependent dehydrogenase (short-subunit alcohol dehydrogenase family)
VPRFDDTNILITGASSGIGFATAHRLANEGARIIGISRNLEKLNKAVALWKDSERHIALSVDLQDPTALDGLPARIAAIGSPLHAAVFSAGTHSLRPLQMLNTSNIDELLNSNIRSTLLCTKAFLKSAARTGASVVWVSSAAALIGNFGESAYAAAKGGVIAACRSLATELAARSIRINVVAPGVVDTAMSQAWLSHLTPEQIDSVRKRHLLGFGKPEDVAGAITFLLSSDARWITGTCLTIDGGLTCH